MSTTIARDDIREFAAAVRTHLDDLPDDDAEELVDGLEADLADQADEAGDGFLLPDAAAYAAELRTAAGLPERLPGRTRRPFWSGLRRGWSSGTARTAAAMRSTPFGAWVLDTLVALRPVWWLLRAAVLFLVLVPLLGIGGPRRGDLLDHFLMLRHPAAWALLAALVLLSVQWGRGKWAPTRWLRIVRTVVAVAAAVIAPFVLSAAFLTITSIVNAASVTYDGVDVYQPSYTPGLAVDGERVRNIFAYDAEGAPIEHVQLFDQNGRPLTTVGPSGEREEIDAYFWGGGGPTTVAEREIGRQPVWNVFPLRELGPDAWSAGEPAIDEAVTPVFPFAEVPSVAEEAGGTSGETEAAEPPTDAVVPNVTPSPSS